MRWNLIKLWSYHWGSLNEYSLYLLVLNDFFSVITLFSHQLKVSHSNLLKSGLFPKLSLASQIVVVLLFWQPFSLEILISHYSYKYNQFNQGSNETCAYRSFFVLRPELEKLSLPKYNEPHCHLNIFTLVHKRECRRNWYIYNSRECLCLTHCLPILFICELSIFL